MMQNSQELPRPTRVVLFDIDGTLIEEDENVWTGGSASYWQNLCEKIRAKDLETGQYTLFGLATAKEKGLIEGKDFDSDDWGDVTTDMILEKGGYQNGSGLKKFIELNLNFFTAYKNKATHALDKARELYPHLKKKTCWLIDNTMQHIDEALSAGYQAFFVEDVSSENLSIKEKQKKVERLTEGFLSRLYNGYNSVLFQEDDEVLENGCAVPSLLPCEHPLMTLSFAAEKQKTSKLDCQAEAQPAHSNISEDEEHPARKRPSC